MAKLRAKAARRPFRGDDPGWVYAMGPTGATEVKIGRTADDPALRLVAMQTFHPSPCRLHAVVGTNAQADLEAAMHRHHAARLVRGEWFRLTHGELFSLAHLRAVTFREGEIVDVDARDLLLAVPYVEAVTGARAAGELRYFGRRLAWARRRHGLSVRRLARAAGLWESELREMEASTLTPEPRVLTLLTLAMRAEPGSVLADAKG